MLLIAGYGFLGAELAAQSQGPFLALNRSADGPAIACDITSAQDLNALTREPTHIIHCASSGRGGGPDRYREVYVGGVKALLARFPSAHLTFASSTSVYGQTDGSLVTEQSATSPSRETSCILLEAEEITLASGGTVARLAGLYGPNRSHLLKTYLAGNSSIEGDGTRHINQIHREDAASALLHLIAHSASGLYNVADSTPLQQSKCYAALSQLTGHPIPPNGPQKLDSKRGWSDKKVSNAKLLATGWSPKYADFLAAVPALLTTHGSGEKR